MPSSLSLLVMLLAIALAIAGAALLPVAVLGVVAVLFEVMLLGFSNDGLG